jgi:hypothetical protein
MNSSSSFPRRIFLGFFDFDDNDDKEISLSLVVNISNGTMFTRLLTAKFIPYIAPFEIAYILS